MQSIINKVLYPKKYISEFLPKDIDIITIKNDALVFFKQALKDCEPSSKPKLINISGIPASGKSYLCKKIKQENPNLLYIGFDDVMENLSCYQTEHKLNKEKAFERWELPARFIGYQLLKHAINNNLSILFEHSNATPHHLELYEKIISLGYDVEIRFVDTDLDVALSRLENRDRYFPADRVVERKKILEELIPQYQKIVTNFRIIKAE